MNDEARTFTEEEKEEMERLLDRMSEAAGCDMREHIRKHGQRLADLAELIQRGLATRTTLPDGSAVIDYPDPDHPDVVAFRWGSAPPAD